MMDKIYNENMESSDEETFTDASPDKALQNEEIVNNLIESHAALTLDKDNDQIKENETFLDCENHLPDEDGQRDYEKTLSKEQLLANKEKAETLKIEGNDQFKNKEYQLAMESYTTALSLCPLDCVNERSILYGNRAAANIQVDAKLAAIDDCTKALELNPNYMKALIRRAKLYEETDKLDESLADFKHILEMDPGYSDARQALMRLPPLIDERNEKLKTEMMGKLKDLGNMILKPFGLSTNNFQMQQDPNTGSYSVNFKNNPAQ